MGNIAVSTILHLLEIDFLTNYVVENAENSHSEPLDFNIFWGGMPPNRLLHSHLYQDDLGLKGKKWLATPLHVNYEKASSKTGVWHLNLETSA